MQPLLYRYEFPTAAPKTQRTTEFTTHCRAGMSDDMPLSEGIRDRNQSDASRKCTERRYINGTCLLVPCTGTCSHAPHVRGRYAADGFALGMLDSLTGACRRLRFKPSPLNHTISMLRWVCDHLHRVSLLLFISPVIFMRFRTDVDPKTPQHKAKNPNNKRMRLKKTSRSFLRGVLAFAALISSSVGSTSCWYPDSVTIAPDTPCITNGSASACCNPNAFCLENGLCYEDGVVTRSSCTDKSWTDPACPSFCAQGKSNIPWSKS